MFSNEIKIQQSTNSKQKLFVYENIIDNNNTTYDILNNSNRW